MLLGQNVRYSAPSMNAQTLRHHHEWERRWTLRRHGKTMSSNDCYSTETKCAFPVYGHLT